MRSVSCKAMPKFAVLFIFVLHQHAKEMLVLAGDVQHRLHGLHLRAYKHCVLLGEIHYLRVLSAITFHELCMLQKVLKVEN